MAEPTGGCRRGSVWPPGSGGEGRVAHRSMRKEREHQVRLRLAEVLIAHGVAAEDVHLMVPPARRLRAALARQERREADAAAAEDTTVCSAALSVCPEHGETLLPTWRGTRCAVRGCRRRWRGNRWAQHCDQPMVAVVENPATGRRYRLCAAHLAIEQAAVPGLTVVTPPPEET